MSSFEAEIMRTQPVLSSLLPFFPSFVQSGESQRRRLQRLVLINPVGETMIMIEGSGIVEAMFGDLSSKDGPLPASKTSIEAMPVVKIIEEGAECAICLEEYEVGGEAKEMPCKHRYHSDCIEKWLGIHGSCPVCRYKMPVEEEEEGKKTADIDEEVRERRIEEEFGVTIYIGGGDRGDSGYGNNSSGSTSNHESADE